MMMNLNPGENVFFRHPEHSWICGVVQSSGKEGVNCMAQDGIRKEVIQNEVLLIKKQEDVEPLHSDVLNDAPDDLLNLTVLHEATLLRCLYMRYMSDIVYTNIGAIVVALNPFSFSIPRYQDTEMTKYLCAGRSLDKSSLPSNLVPHSWAQAHITYYEMVDNLSNQCIIVSGESGAGKTEATKIVLKYLGIVSTLGGNEEEKKAALQVGDRLVSCSPILECFGNAKTVRNDNSSRFGKFMKVKFNSKHLVVGAETIKYLLEKSRIVSAAKGERLYHSFYLLLKGELTKEFDMEGINQYKSLCSGDMVHNSEYDTEQDFNNVCKSMRSVGMKEHEVKSVWRVAAAVMTLLNVRFLPGEDGCTIDSNSMRYLKKAVKLLDINESGLIHELLTSTRVLPGNQLATKANDVAAAVDIRDAMCKHLYDGVFTWLVERCNDLCDVDSDGNWIGLLDIFGFEDFKVNSFEQICINLTNEHLQYHYNFHIFQRDMEECKNEGVDMTNVKFPDNTGCLKMLTAQGGIFPLLDECCWLGGGTDTGFLEKVVDGHESNPFFKKERVSRDTFCVRHYAADVTYNVIDWIEKNRDTLKDPIKLLVRGSSDPLISQCLPAPIPPAERKGGKEFTVGGFFRNQLTSLMELINSTNPHWIRCIKPHPAKKPKMFHGRQTMNQLESSGVLGTIKIRKAGYPVRIPKEFFFRKYHICTTLDSSDEDAAMLDVIKKAGIQVPSQAQVARTKVFLKAEAYNMLERLRSQHLIQTGLTLQCIARGYIGRADLFRMYVLRHKAELLRLKWEKAIENIQIEEAQKRETLTSEEDEMWGTISNLELDKRCAIEEAEAFERERRRAEEEERRRREEEERRRQEEARRLAELQKWAAICIQRHVRGELVRTKLYRHLLEEHRAAWEYGRELACERERIEAHKLDKQRAGDEKVWIQWLNSVDHLKRKKQQDEQRAMEKTHQKMRIRIRELQRQEDQIRLKIEVDEGDSHYAAIARWRCVAEHLRKTEEDRHQRLVRLQAKRSTLSSNQSAPHSPGIRARAERSAQSDARIKETLTQYAVSRARQYDVRPESQPVMPAGYRQVSTGRCTGVDSTLFGKVQQNWLRQQESMDLLSVPSIQRGPRSKSMPEDDGIYSGPHRTIEASMQSMSPLLQFPMHPSSSLLTTNTINNSRNSNTEPQCTATLGKGRIDWDSVFNS